VELSGELEANLRELAAAGPVELRENGARVAPLSTLSWEVRGTATKPLLHLWSARHNLTRRVLAITDHTEERRSPWSDSTAHGQTAWNLCACFSSDPSANSTAMSSPDGLQHYAQNNFHTTPLSRFRVIKTSSIHFL